MGLINIPVEESKKLTFNLVEEVAKLDKIEKTDTNPVFLDITNSNKLMMQIVLSPFEEIDSMDDVKFNVAVMSSYKKMFEIIYNVTEFPDEVTAVLYNRITSLVFSTRFLQSLYNIIKKTPLDDVTTIYINSAFYNKFNDAVNDENLIQFISIINVINIDKYSAILPLSRDNIFTTLFVAADKSNFDRYTCIMRTLNICYNFAIVDPTEYKLLFSQLYGRNDFYYLLYCVASIDLYAKYNYLNKIYNSMLLGVYAIIEDFPIKEISHILYNTSLMLKNDNKYGYTFTLLKDSKEFPRISTAVQDLCVAGNIV